MHHVLAAVPPGGTAPLLLVGMGFFPVRLLMIMMMMVVVVLMLMMAIIVNITS